MSPAVGIHDHPSMKTGLIATDPSRPILDIDLAINPIAASSLPVPPDQQDHFSGVTFALDGNDVFGICGPTSCDNFVRSTSKFALGAQHNVGLPAVQTLYRQSGNPNFDPSNPNTEDNGVEMADMLSMWAAHKLGDVEIVAYGRSLAKSDESLERLVAIFGGALYAVNLLQAQQAQSEGASPVWDYKSTPEWGGHAIFGGKYVVQRSPSGLVVAVNAPVISWEKPIGTTDPFRQHQLEEVWIPITRWHLEHPNFLAGVNVEILAEEFKSLTGKTLPITPPSPTPSPAPTPSPSPTPTSDADAADKALWTALKPWTQESHVGANHKAATAAKEWAAAKGLG